MRYTLSIINIICMFMHLLFQMHIKNTGGIYGFVLLENLMMTFTFLLMAYLMFKSRSCVSFLYINLIFWLVFTIGVICIKPSITTLDIFQPYLPPIPQWTILFSCGIITAILTVAEIIIRIRNEKRANHEH